GVRASPAGGRGADRSGGSAATGEQRAPAHQERGRRGARRDGLLRAREETQRARHHAALARSEARPGAVRRQARVPGGPVVRHLVAQPRLSMRIQEFQRRIEEIYYARDAARGLAGTHMWFCEEVGELTRALRRGQRAELEGEFADVLAWLSTLASIAGVDLEA